MTALSARLKTEIPQRQWATISFIPEDLIWFDWVLREVEGYPLPSGLAGARTRHGFLLPDRLTLFPDRWNPLNFEEYPEALETSRFLLVIVSPNSAKAPWVDDHLRDFKAAGGEERIIAFVVDGKPNTPAVPAEGEWLPKWLAWRFADNTFAAADATEPVIIDARGSGPGLQLARETLLAALLSTTHQELERMGGLMPPLDLSRSCATCADEVRGALTVAPIPVEPAVKSPIKLPRQRLFAAVGAAIALFAMGWTTRHLTATAPAPPVAPPPPSAPAPPAPSAPQTPLPDPTPPPAEPSSEPAAAPTASAPAVPAKEDPIKRELTAREKALLDEVRRQEAALRAEYAGLVAAADGALQKGRTLQAVDFYSAAMAAAERYFARCTDDFATAASHALLCGKLGALQMRVVSAVEARASYERGRGLLLQLQTRPEFTPVHAQCLQEIESALRAPSPG